MAKLAKVAKISNNISPPADGLFKLDLACGDSKKEGSIGLDIVKTPSADHVVDLTKFPWPIDDGVVDELHCSHFFEHLTGKERMSFMDECWRVMKSKTQLIIICPHWSSMRSVQDPTHQWPPVAEASFLYFNKQWREDNKLSHYAITCDFDYTYGFSMDNDTVVRNVEYQQFAVKHYNNAVLDLHVTLTKRG